MKYLITLIFIIFIQSTYAAESSIVAVVNSSPITSLDLKKRIDLITRSNNKPNLRASKEELKSQVLQMLIDEKLFDQEAARLKIVIDILEINHTLNMIAKNNNLTLNQLKKLFNEFGISIAELENQIKHQLLWAKIIQTQIEPFITISNQDIKELQISNDHNVSEQVKLAEIAFFPTAENFTQTKKTANDLLVKLKKGESFSKLAKKFSQASSANADGDIGWFDIKQLSTHFAEAISGLKTQAVSSLIIKDSNIYIIKILERRTVTNPQAAAQSNKDAELHESLYQKKKEMLIKQYLLNLRRQSYISVK